jgi:phenylacetate-coenzyme A ligase PaaK-like adenylate-forming protein
MNTIEKLFELPEYSIENNKKRVLLLGELNELCSFHYSKCTPYKRILDNLKFDLTDKINKIEDLPYLPVRLFKTQKIKSIPEREIFKTLFSSGTSSQQLSKIYLDKETSVLQIKALASIITSYIGNKRLPMIIIDTENTIKNRNMLNARGAGLIGLSNFGRDHFFALDENMNLRADELLKFVDKHKTENILLFGFTFMIWQYFYKAFRDKNLDLNLNTAILIHSGGWKKLIDDSVSNKLFKEALNKQFKLRNIYNFYGMAEQVGSIFMECEEGYLHAPNFAEILIRDYTDWSILPKGKEGIIQTISVLPRSYPGHSLLTEDLGTIIGIDDCKCGRKGTYFIINGRIPKAELRGCSDTHAEMVLNSTMRN